MTRKCFEMQNKRSFHVALRSELLCMRDAMFTVLPKRQ